MGKPSYKKEDIIPRLIQFPTSVVKEFMSLVEENQDLRRLHPQGRYVQRGAESIQAFRISLRGAGGKRNIFCPGFSLSFGKGTIGYGCGRYQRRPRS